METTTTLADSTELSKVVETGEDIEARIEKESKTKNRYMTKSKTAVAQAATPTRAAISALPMMNKWVARSRSNLRKSLSMKMKSRLKMDPFAFRQKTEVSNQRGQIQIVVIMTEVKIAQTTPL